MTTPTKTNLDISRRHFLQRATLAAGACATFPSITYAQADSANDTVRIAIAGVRNKGRDHIETFSKIPGVRIVALCDPDAEVLQRGLKLLERIRPKVDGHSDIREVLDRKDVDAVVVATPNHWHSLMTVWACQAGKDVYVEKPISHNVWEGRKAIEAARKYNRIVQAGLQSRTDPALLEAFAYLKSGQLGKMRLVRGFCYKRRDSIGQVSGAQRISAQINYDLWCGPTPLVPLMRKNLHYDWHWVWPTGNGDLGNQGVHEVDMCRWVIGQNTLPPRVMSYGGRYGYVDDGETPNTQIVFYDYKPVPMIFEVRGLPSAKGEDGATTDHYKRIRVGLVVECEHGFFAGGASGGVIIDNDGKRVKDWNGPGGRDHQENFIKAVRSRKVEDLTADIEEGHISSALCHMGNISQRLGQHSSPDEVRERVQGNKDTEEAFDRYLTHMKTNEIDLANERIAQGPWLSMDTLTERFVGNWSETANLLLKRSYREPYVITEKV